MFSVQKIFQGPATGQILEIAALHQHRKQSTQESIMTWNVLKGMFGPVPSQSNAQEGN